MVGAGVLMIVLSLYGLFLLWRGKLADRRRYLFLLPFAMALPYIANTAGWIMTEIGRQPWVVFGLMKTEAGVSNAVGPEAVLLSLIIFTLLYGVLAVADVYLMVRYGRQADTGPKPAGEDDDASLLVSAY